MICIERRYTRERVSMMPDRRERRITEGVRRKSDE